MRSANSFPVHGEGGSEQSELTEGVMGEDLM